jgi:lipid-binding SYLF domain-containing protein
VDSLLDNRLEVGTEVVAVAGPDEAVAEGASGSMKEQILVYARHKGLFAGVALKGAVITPDDSLNRSTYGTTAREILTASSPMSLKPGLDALGEALSTFTPTSN